MTFLRYTNFLPNFTQFYTVLTDFYTDIMIVECL